MKKTRLPTTLAQFYTKEYKNYKYQKEFVLLITAISSAVIFFIKLV
jgi:hypothetical protein